MHTKSEQHQQPCGSDQWSAWSLFPRAAVRIFLGKPTSKGPRLPLLLPLRNWFHWYSSLQTKTLLSPRVFNRSTLHEFVSMLLQSSLGQGQSLQHIVAADLATVETLQRSLRLSPRLHAQGEALASLPAAKPHGGRSECSAKGWGLSHLLGVKSMGGGCSFLTLDAIMSNANSAYGFTPT